MGNKLVLFGFCIILGLFSIGCWDIAEINRRSTTPAIFIDLDEEGQYHLGASFVVPGTMLPPVIGTEQQFEKRNFLLTSKGQGLVDTWFNLQAVAYRDIYFGQLSVIVITETIAAEKDIGSLLNFFGREPDVPLNANLLLTRADPEYLFDLKANNNWPIGQYVNLYFQVEAKRNNALPMTLWNLFRIIDNDTSDPYLPFIEPAQGQYLIEGVGLFHQKKLVGTLSGDENQDLAMLLNTNVGYLTVPLPNENLIAFSNLRTKTKIQTSLTEGKPIFDIYIAASGFLQETIPEQRGITAQELREIEKETGEAIKARIENLLLKMQVLKTDPVGFRGEFQKKYPRLAEETEWDVLYSKADFNVTVNFQSVKVGAIR